jgi:O-antigen/teichoic acid export membrane protein
MVSEKNKLSKSFFSLSIVQIANNILPLITVPYISRIFGPDKFGELSFATSFVAYFLLFIGFGFDLSATRKISQNPNDKAHRSLVFSEVLSAQGILFLISVLIFSILLFVMPEFQGDKRVVLFTFLLCISALLTQNWLFMAMQDLPKIALFNFIAKLAFTFSIFFVVHKKSDYVYQPLLVGCIQIGVAILSFAWAVKRYDLTFIKVPFKRCFKYLWEEKIIFLSLVIGSLYTNSNVFILGLFRDSVQVGYYSAGMRLIQIVQTILSTPLSMALYPFIGQAFGQSKENGILTTQKITPLIFIICVIVGLGLFIVGPPFLTLLYGEKFKPANDVLRILAFMPLVLALSDIFGIQIMLNLKLDKVLFRIILYGSILSITVSLLTVRRWGYVATSLNWLITEIFITVSLFFALKKQGIHVFNLEYFSITHLKNTFEPIKRKFLK